jgi:hypothetical protein
MHMAHLETPQRSRDGTALMGTLLKSVKNFDRFFISRTGLNVALSI